MNTNRPPTLHRLLTRGRSFRTHSPPTTTDSATQTPSSSVACTEEASLACSYIDNLVGMERTDGEIVPVEFICPLTFQAMKCPVVVSDGFTYEHDAIQRWMQVSGTSPLTREVLQDDILIKNRAIEQLIIRFYRGREKRSLDKASTTT